MAINLDFINGFLVSQSGVYTGKVTSSNRVELWFVNGLLVDKKTYYNYYAGGGIAATQLEFVNGLLVGTTRTDYLNPTTSCLLPTALGNGPYYTSFDRSYITTQLMKNVTSFISKKCTLRPGDSLNNSYLIINGDFEEKIGILWTPTTEIDWFTVDAINANGNVVASGELSYWTGTSIKVSFNPDSPEKIIGFRLTVLGTVNQSVIPGLPSSFYNRIPATGGYEIYFSFDSKVTVDSGSSVQQWYGTLSNPTTSGSSDLDPGSDCYWSGTSLRTRMAVHPETTERMWKWVPRTVLRPLSGAYVEGNVNDYWAGFSATGIKFPDGFWGFKPELYYIGTIRYNVPIARYNAQISYVAWDTSAHDELGGTMYWFRLYNFSIGTRNTKRIRMHGVFAYNICS